MNQNDIENLIKQFNQTPERSKFDLIYDWYTTYGSTAGEYGLCVYLFLIGANIKFKYIPFDQDTYKDQVKYVRDNTEIPDQLLARTRIGYFTSGSRSGMYK